MVMRSFTRVPDIGGGNALGYVFTVALRQVQAVLLGKHLAGVRKPDGGCLHHVHDLRITYRIFTFRVEVDLVDRASSREYLNVHAVVGAQAEVNGLSSTFLGNHHSPFAAFFQSLPALSFRG